MPLNIELRVSFGVNVRGHFKIVWQTVTSCPGVMDALHLVWVSISRSLIGRWRLSSASDWLTHVQGQDNGDSGDGWSLMAITRAQSHQASILRHLHQTQSCKYVTRPGQASTADFIRHFSALISFHSRIHAFLFWLLFDLLTRVKMMVTTFSL